MNPDIYLHTAPPSPTAAEWLFWGLRWTLWALGTYSWWVLLLSRVIKRRLPS